MTSGDYNRSVAFEIMDCKDVGGEDTEWSRFFATVKEQPHSPYTVIVADFKQLQPVVSGGLCKSFCEQMESITMDTVYRSKDEVHLLFLNRIRDTQPDRDMLDKYFGPRHWGTHHSLEWAVAQGIQIGKELNEHFVWLCESNKGASDVCRAALNNIGLSDSEIEEGYTSSLRVYTIFVLKGCLLACLLSACCLLACLLACLPVYLLAYLLVLLASRRKPRQQAASK